MSSDFHYYKSRAPMCESILKILSILTFLSDITNETPLRRRSFQTKKHFYLIRC